MASESLQCKTLALRVSVHCEGCKKKVKKLLQRVEGVYRCDVDGRSNKATVTGTGKVSADTLIRKLRRAGKHAEQWPEEQQQQQQPSGNQCPEETKNQAAEPDKFGEPAESEKPVSGDVAEPSDPKVTTEEPKKTTAGDGETAAPAEDGGMGSTDANASGSGSSVGDGGVETVTPQQPSNPKRRRKQQGPPQQEEKAGEATMATAASMQTSHTSHLPAPPLHQQQQQPVHVMSYNVARPSSSAAYYAAAPVAAPASARPPLPPPPQEHSYAYSPYRYGYYNNYYYGGHGTPQRSAGSPARNSYGDLFSDDNANSCRVM